MTLDRIVMKLAFALALGALSALFSASLYADEPGDSSAGGHHFSVLKSDLREQNTGNVAIVGSTSYSISNANQTASATVNQIANNSGNNSGTLSLRLFVTTTQISGPFTYWIVGQEGLGTLAAGFSFNNLSGTVPLMLVPDGIYYIHLGVFEFGSGCTGTSDGYCLDDYVTFSSQVQSIAGVYSTYVPPPSSGVANLAGSYSYLFSNPNGTMTQNIDQIANGSSTVTSGALSHRLFLTTTPISGAFTYWTAGRVALDPLPPGYVYNSLSQTTTLLTVPDGIYYVHMGIFESYSGCTSSDGFCVDDYRTFGKQLMVTGGVYSTVSSGPPTIVAVEYHHSGFDHYFVTPVAAEIALLDAHQPPFELWSRTGYFFSVYVPATAPAGAVATCRFFNTSFAPKSSHFYAPHGFGCEDTIRLFPDWGLEDAQLFFTMLPDAGGQCPSGTNPLYRLYNNGMGGAPNHRFVLSPAVRQTMISQGYVPEGAGIGVGMCVPP